MCPYVVVHHSRFDILQVVCIRRVPGHRERVVVPTITSSHITLLCRRRCSSVPPGFLDARARVRKINPLSKKRAEEETFFLFISPVIFLSRRACSVVNEILFYYGRVPRRRRIAHVYEPFGVGSRPITLARSFARLFVFTSLARERRRRLFSRLTAIIIIVITAARLHAFLLPDETA